jgi:long-chain acyl-CoA synthetase
MNDSVTDWAEREQGRVRYPQYLLQESMIRSALHHPDKLALVVEGERYSYRQLLEHSSRLARQLAQLGVRRGERVAVYMDNTWPCISAIYAILMAGGVFLLVNPQTKAEKLQYILEDSGAVALISDAHLARQFIPAGQALPALRTVIVSGSLADMPATKQSLLLFAETVASYQGLPPKAGSIPNDLAALIYTSGSTGNPKGVMQTHRSMLFAAWSLLEYLRIEPNDRILLVLPLAFDYGLYQLLMAMAIGATLVVERSFTYPGQIYQRMRDEGVTVFPGVPTIFSTMIAAHQKKQLHFPTVAKVTNTAARLPSEYVTNLKQIFPQALIFKMYGLTECKRVCYLEPELLDAKPESVGKAIPGTEVFLLTLEGEPVPPGEVGILHVRGPHVMAGYWRQPALSAEMLRPGQIPGEQILCSGDWFTTDQEGFLYFYGRSDDIIKSRGEKVSPVEVENVLHGIVGIKEAVVVGIADELLGQAVRAFVVLFADCQLTPREVQKACAARLENFMVPKEVIILEQMPKMANDKIDRKALTTWGEADGR